MERYRTSRWRWHLDEVFVTINGKTRYLWRTVDHECEVLEGVVTKRRDRKAGLKVLSKLMKRNGRVEALTMDKLRTYRAAMREVGLGNHETEGHWITRLAENLHLPLGRRERAMLRFQRKRSLQKCGAIHASVYKHFNLESSLSSRDVFKRTRAATRAE